MKTSLTILTLFGAAMVALQAAEPTRASGPKGGRLLKHTEPQAEFHIEADRTVTITFYDAAQQPVAAGRQTVSVIADAPGGKQVIEFENKEGVLASKTTLPDGEGYILVVQLRTSPDAKPQNFRFKLETHKCESCSFQEYACVCHE